MRTPARPGQRLRSRPPFLHGLLAAALCAACAPAPVPPAPAPPPPPPAAAPPGPALAPWAVTLLPGLHLLGGVAPNAAYAVETSEGILLVDTCKEADAEPILHQMKELGLDPLRIRHILLTHAHGDHVLGARKLREMSGARIHAGRGDADVLRAGGPREAIFSIFGVQREIHGTPVDVALDGGEILRSGAALVRVIATPGHTPGSVCFLLEKDGLRILFTGDTVLSLTTGAPLAGAGIYAADLAPCFRGDAAAFEASLRVLAALPPPDLVLPGHPRNDPVPENPRIPAWWWRQLLDRGLEGLRAMRARRAENGEDFLDGESRELLPGLRSWGGTGGAAAYGLLAPDRSHVLVNAPGDGTTADLLRARFRAAGPAWKDPAAVLLTSTAPAAVGGLRGLVEATGCTVRAPAAGIEEVRRLCPPGTRVLPAEDLPGATGIPVTCVPAPGAPSPGVSYLFTVAGKGVIATGELPDPVTLEPEYPLLRWSGREVPDPAAALPAVANLRRIQPDLWLPLHPLCAQDANLHGSAWRRVLDHTKNYLERGARR